MMVARYLVSFNSRNVCLEEFFERGSPPVGGECCEKTRDDSRKGGGVLSSLHYRAVFPSNKPVQGRVKVTRFS